MKLMQFFKYSINRYLPFQKMLVILVVLLFLTNLPLYANSSGEDVPTFVVNLDLPPEERWFHIVKNYRDKTGEMIEVLQQVIPKRLLDIAVDIIDEFRLKEFFPQEYAQELNGISKGLNMSLVYTFLINLGYEATLYFTSIVACGEKGNIWHTRNLDLGLKNFLIVQAVNLHYQSNGKSCFHFSGCDF